MRQVQDVLAYARTQADELGKDMAWNTGSAGYGGYWKAVSDKAAPKIGGRGPTFGRLALVRSVTGRMVSGKRWSALSDTSEF